MVAKVISGLFVIERNRPEAIRQEFDLAKQHYDGVCASRDVFNPDHTERFRDARERLNRARELQFKSR